jgi:hypothetical protein
MRPVLFAWYVVMPCKATAWGVAWRDLGWHTAVCAAVFGVYVFVWVPKVRLHHKQADTESIGDQEM